MMIKRAVKLWGALGASVLVVYGCGTPEAHDINQLSGGSGGASGGSAGAAGSAGSAGSSGAPGSGGSQGGSSGNHSAGSGGSSAGAGGAGGACAGSSPFAVRVVDYEFGSGQAFGQQNFPKPILGPPRGAGCCAGSTDVVSLGLGGWVVLELGDTILDGPGADFIVFENAFEYGDGQVFTEAGSVAVSADGETWHEFPCSKTEAPWDQCAGLKPVYANASTNSVDPTDPAVAGGDAFDLADLGLTEARWVKITDRADLPDTVFDLDAVAVVNGACSAR